MNIKLRLSTLIDIVAILIAASVFLLPMLAVFFTYTEPAFAKVCIETMVGLILPGVLSIVRIMVSYPQTRILGRWYKEEPALALASIFVPLVLIFTILYLYAEATR